MSYYHNHSEQFKSAGPSHKNQQCWHATHCGDDRKNTPNLFLTPRDIDPPTPPHTSVSHRPAHHTPTRLSHPTRHAHARTLRASHRAACSEPPRGHRAETPCSISTALCRALNHNSFPLPCGTSAVAEGVASDLGSDAWPPMQCL